MKVTVKYKNREVEVEIPDEKLEELVKEKKQTGYERCDRSDIYYYLNCYGEIGSECDDFVSGDTKSYNSGNYYTSKELAENVARAEILMRRIRRRAAEISEPIDWKNYNSKKWSIYFDCGHKEISAMYSTVTRKLFNIYFDTKEHANQVIEEFKDELVWYFTEYKDRMDI